MTHRASTKPFGSRSPSAARVIERPRLLSLLDEAAADARAIGLVAPAGYGKTVLARQWGHRQERVVWHEANEASSDIAFFARALALALEELAPGIRRKVDARLTGTLGDSIPTDIGVMLNRELAQCAADTWLIVDDAHLLGDGPSAALLHLLVSGNALRLLFTSRIRPGFATARAVVYGSVAMITREQLQFDDDELAVMTGEMEVDEPIAAGRWPVLVSLTSHGTGARAPTNQHDVFEFIAEDVVSHLSAETRRALPILAACASIQPHAAHAILGDASAVVLSEAVCAGLLTLDVDGTYRLHALVADFLVQQLATLDPSERDRFIDRAFGLALRSRDWDGAFHVASRARRHDLVARLVSRSYPALLNEGRHATLKRWREELAEGSALGVLVAAELALTAGAFAAAEAQASTAAALATSTRMRARALWVAGLAAYIPGRLHPASEYYEASLECAQTPMARAHALWGRFMCASTLDPAEAPNLLETYRHAAPPTPTTIVRYASGRLSIESVESAWTTYVDEAALAAELVGEVPDPRIRTSFWTNYTDTLIDVGRPARARRALDAHRDDCRDGRLEFTSGRQLLMEGKLATLMRRFAHADDAFGASDVHTAADPNARAAVSCYRILLAVASGGAFGDAQAGSLKLAQQTLVWERHYRGCLALSAAWDGRKAEARHLAAAVADDMLAAQGRTLALFALGLCSGEPADLRRAAHAAAETHDLFALLVAVRGHPDMIPVLVADAKLEPVVTEALAVADGALARRYGVVLATAGSSLDLSKREQEVLGLLVEGLTNRQIARRLFIAETTAKLHVRRILAKSGTRSRDEAAALLGT
jgi:DNA-binding CsgD family transcriptional regulator